MNFSILIPHYKTGKMTAYCIHQLLKYKGMHELEIIVVDNSNGEGVELFSHYPIKLLTYPPHLMQSHGIAFDYALQQDAVSNEYFITVESDSFPTQDNWLDYYENLVNHNYDSAGSLLHLSGGKYLHPAGAMYGKWIWQEAYKYVRYSLEYSFFPNLAIKELFPCHLMVHRDFMTEFLKDPEKHVKIHHSYRDTDYLIQLERYLPIAQSVFHNGMGNENESYTTYGARTFSNPICDNTQPMIYRMGLEPGQWLSYYQDRLKKVFHIPTEIVWMPNRINQQQEYTIMENGFKHLWGVTTYSGVIEETVKDISLHKEKLMNELYDSIK